MIGIASLVAWMWMAGQTPANVELGNMFLFPPKPAEHVIEIKTRRERPAECRNDENKSRAIASACLKALDKCPAGDGSVVPFDLKCRDAQPECQAWDEDIANYQEYCADIVTKELWIDGAKWGVLRESEGK